MPSQPSDSAQLHVPPNHHSCIVCRQRKVKCDKQQRCSNCIKARVECVYGVPSRPRRRVGNGVSSASSPDVSKEELLHRLRRYEALFAKHGLNFENTEHKGDNRKSQSLKSSHAARNDTIILDHVAGPPQGEDAKSRLTAQSNNLWIDLSGEILEDFFDRDSPATSIPENPSEASDPLNLSSTFEPGPESLTTFHPPTIQIFKLWEKFLHNVNPLLKIIHVPTVQRELLEASLNLEKVSRPFEALMFAIYASAITSLSDEECEELTDVTRAQLQKRYCKVAQQALSRAGIFGTLDIVVLQAAVLLIISILSKYDPGEFWVLAGIVLRIGQRIGLHRKSYQSNLSVIETQIRRRLWWQIVALDARCAQRCRVDTLVRSEHWDVPLPLNVNDSDLTPDMIVEPRGHLGSTEMTLRLMMFEIGKFLRVSVAMAPFGGSWQKLSNASVPLAKKDEVIDELEEMLESRYLRYCDPVIPLHILARSIAKIVCCRMRLTTRHPRQFPDRGSSMAQEEKEKLFNICLTIIKQDNFLHSVDCVRGFLWHVDLIFQVDAFVYLLSELRYRNPEPLTEKAWPEISKAFKYHPNMLLDMKNPLSVAIGNLALKSWESWESRIQDHDGYQQRSRPEFFLKLLEQQAKYSVSSSAEPYGDPGRMDLDANPPNSHEMSAAANWDSGPSSVSDPLAPIDWNYWNDLIQDGDTYTIGSLAPQTNSWST